MVILLYKALYCIMHALFLSCTFRLAREREIEREKEKEREREREINFPN